MRKRYLRYANVTSNLDTVDKHNFLHGANDDMLNYGQPRSCLQQRPDIVIHMRVANPANNHDRVHNFDRVHNYEQYHYQCYYNYSPTDLLGAGHYLLHHHDWHVVVLCR
ncbi:hypothetical protein LTR70_000371 [Exophiala xenobiotica]|nr:hypothetical protein LTR70_000371 [Exophiala xenobiotica]